jgi:hypothetical protein
MKKDKTERCNVKFYACDVDYIDDMTIDEAIDYFIDLREELTKKHPEAFKFFIKDESLDGSFVINGVRKENDKEYNTRMEAEKQKAIKAAQARAKQKAKQVKQQEDQKAQDLALLNSLIEKYGVPK